MMHNKADRSNEALSDTLPLEEVMFSYFTCAVYSKYLASDLLKRLEETKNEAENLVDSCLSVAVENDKMPVAMQHIKQFLSARQYIHSFYTKIIGMAEDALKNHGVNYSIEQHQTSSGEVILKIDGFASPVNSAGLPMASTLPEELGIRILGSVVREWQKLEGIVRYTCFRPSTN